MKKQYCLILFFFCFNTPLRANSSNYFSQGYIEARSKFRSAIESLKNSESKTYPIANKLDQDLTVDIAYFPALKDPKSLLILMSGVHGVEAYAGSAIQLQFLDKMMNTMNNENLGILLIHSLNPYGFMNNRRVDENNIDLNRNFAITDNHFKQKNEDYLKLSKLLNPQNKVSSSFKDKIIFYGTTALKILKSSVKSLRAATLKGQFDVVKGIFFGGKKPQSQSEILKDIISHFSLTEYEKILTVDLHTGYGERGKLHHFGFSSKNIENQNFLNYLFKELPIDLGSDDEFYEVTGDSTVFIESLFSISSTHAGITFEFGTLDSQKSLGAIESLRRVILENQGYHHGYKNKKSKKVVKSLFVDMFNPDDDNWRNSVLEQANKSLKTLISRLQEY